MAITLPPPTITSCPQWLYRQFGGKQLKGDDFKCSSLQDILIESDLIIYSIINSNWRWADLPDWMVTGSDMVDYPINDQPMVFELLAEYGDPGEDSLPVSLRNGMLLGAQPTSTVPDFDVIRLEKEHYLWVAKPNTENKSESDIAQDTLNKTLSMLTTEYAFHDVASWPLFDQFLQVISNRT